MDDLVELQKVRIETLEERIRQLEDVLSPPGIVLPVEWRLTSSEARVFAHLTSRDHCSKDSIMAALYSDRPDDEVEIKIVDVFICKLRKKVVPFGIEIITVWGQGYGLKDRHNFGTRKAA